MSRITFERVIIGILLVALVFLFIRVGVPEARADGGAEFFSLKRREVSALEDISSSLKRIESKIGR